MKILIFVICLVTFSCTYKSGSTNHAKLSQLDSIFSEANFDTLITYNDPCCLHYKGKPLFIIGKSIKDIDTGLSFRPDPNGKYDKFSRIVTDYLSLDDFFSANLSTGSLDGALYFSADKRGRIFRID